jgi:hypothetical protein
MFNNFYEKICSPLCSRKNKHCSLCRRRLTKDGKYFTRTLHAEFILKYYKEIIIDTDTILRTYPYIHGKCYKQFQRLQSKKLVTF